jgi:GT2 family glycosyltransferase
MISVVIISKDEPALDQTLTDIEKQVDALAGTREVGEIVVVDASRGRLDYIRDRHEATVRWLEFHAPTGVNVTIPHQRNAGVLAARGDIIVFTDAGCLPEPGWLESLVAPLGRDESAVAGISLGISDGGPYEIQNRQEITKVTYLGECATLNFAFRRTVFDAVGGFDESFAYGSDVDFSWRLNDRGYRVRLIEEAVIRHDYGSSRRQRRRAYAYGKARARLYRKHQERRKHILRKDPVVVVYPLFLLGLPLTLVFPIYPLLLLIPAWRNRSRDPIMVLIDHLWYGAGVLAELAAR